MLQRDENGLEKCVACFLCAAACPANCIYIEAAENTEENRISSSERYAKVYNIDYNRCIFCGYCVEACPTDAITHGHGFETASLNATNLVMRKEDMLLPVSALTAAKIALSTRCFAGVRRSAVKDEPPHSETELFNRGSNRESAMKVAVSCCSGTYRSVGPGKRSICATGNLAPCGRGASASRSRSAPAVVRAADRLIPNHGLVELCQRHHRAGKFLPGKQHGKVSAGLCQHTAVRAASA